MIVAFMFVDPVLKSMNVTGGDTYRSSESTPRITITVSVFVAAVVGQLSASAMMRRRTVQT